MFSKVLIQLQVAVIFIVLVVTFLDGNFIDNSFTETGGICFTLMLCTLAICHSLENRK